MTETEKPVHDGNRGACALQKQKSLCITTETEEPKLYGKIGACALRKQSSLCSTER